MTVFALDTHKAIAHVPIPAGADVVKFDPGLGRIYAACASGSIAVIQEQDADHYRKLEDFPVQKLVHSLAVDRRRIAFMRPSNRKMVGRWHE